jgi:aryl-phospho-beta-D-glucosidase BglC (GH1 family)
MFIQLKRKMFIQFMRLFVSICLLRKYKLGVVVDLHAAPGSQNPWEHSSSRDGTQEWGTTDASIAQTVQVIEFLASRSALLVPRNPVPPSSEFH